MCKLKLDNNKDGQVLHTEGSDCIRQSAIFIPKAHAAANTDLTVILWLHGWYVENGPDIFIGSGGSSKLPDSVRAANKDVILVAPFLGHKWSTKEVNPKDPDGKKINVVHGSLGLGDLTKNDGVEAYLKEVLTLLEAYQSVTSLKIANLIIAGHSGGGDMMRTATGALGKMLPNLKECWGFDCMYAGGHTYGCWADGLPGVYMYFYLANGSSAAYFADFWKFAYGTPAQPEPQPMNNLFLAPATQGIENMTDQIVFQSVDDIKNKSNQGTQLNAYETIRLKVDALLDTPKAYDSTVTPKLKEHFEVVRDMMKPRIIGLTGAKLTGTKVISRLRQSTCHPPPPPPKPLKKKGH